MKRFILRWQSVLCVLLVTACSPTPQEAIKHFELQSPKPYGYVIGDEIEHRVVVETRQHMQLAKESMPVTGALNRWLQLKAVKTIVTPQFNGELTQLNLTYQVFYAPLEVKMLKIPGFTLRFKQNGQMVEQQVPEWHFTLSPLHELAIRKESGQIYLRPDALPNLIPNQPNYVRFYFCLMMALFAGLYLAYVYGLLPVLQRRRFFKQAVKQLAKLSSNEMGKALSIIHTALNQRNGKPLFKHQLPDFFKQQAEFAILTSELDWFFTFSSHYFFSGRQYVADADLTRLKALCLHCRRIEKESR